MVLACCLFEREARLSLFWRKVAPPSIIYLRFCFFRRIYSNLYLLNGSNFLKILFSKENSLSSIRPKWLFKNTCYRFLAWNNSLVCFLTCSCALKMSFRRVNKRRIHWYVDDRLGKNDRNLELKSNIDLRAYLKWVLIYILL